jgi:hypothetical protein
MQSIGRVNSLRKTREDIFYQAAQENYWNKLDIRQQATER